VLAGEAILNFSKNKTIRAELFENTVIAGENKLLLEEAGYLLERGRIALYDGGEELNLREFLKRASSLIPNFELRFLVYKNIRDRGYQLKAGILDFRVYPRGIKPGEGESKYIIRVLSEREPIDITTPGKDILIARNLKKRLLYAVVDEEGDITYYEVKQKEMRGSLPPLGTDISAKGDLLEERVIIWDPFILNKLNKSWWFGRLTDEGRRLQLSFVESAYLIEHGSIEVLDGDGNVLSLERFIEVASAIESNFYRKYIIYRDLRDKGMVVKTGFKFGSHFRVYEEMPSESVFHSRYLVHLLTDDHTARLPEISRAVRLAHGVKKEMVFAVVDESEAVQYVEIAWVRL